MKFLDHIRPKSRPSPINNHDPTLPSPPLAFNVPTPHFAPNPTARLPPTLLQRLLGYVCPQEDSYNCCEDSVPEAGCMLCDLKDLSQCALVSRQWSQAAQNLLYHHIRIDAVHYCDRETELAIKRKRRSLNPRNGSPPNPPQERLQLLSRTARENALLAHKIQYLKTPYMTRESSVADLARTVSLLPNLLFVDLPEGSYSDDSSCEVLKQELQSRCPRIRYMKYSAGSEGSFHSLAESGHWRGLEALELWKLAVEPHTIIAVFLSLAALRDVKLANMPLLGDSLFAPPSSVNASLRPLTVLTLQNVPNISVGGLVDYVSQPGPQQSLISLTLDHTGVSAPDLHQILSATSNLLSLHCATTVSRALPSSEVPPLASVSLRTLRYEITNADNSSNDWASPSDSYYAHLSSSILSGALPSLTHLYVLSVTPQGLLQPASRHNSLANRSGTTPAPLSLGLKQPLRLFTKSISELEWDLTLISPPSSAHRRGCSTTLGPESLNHTVPLSPRYRKQGRQTVMVGNGFGGFLAVPSQGGSPERPKTKIQRNDVDAWMG